MTALLEVEHVAVQIGGLVAVADLSFTVEEGQVVSLIGPNGAGKTTAFNAITGYMRPRQGRIRFRGQDLAGLSPERIAALGLVRSFQRTSIFGPCTVFENARMALHLRGESGLLGALLRLPGMRREEARLREEAFAMLDFVGLTARAEVTADSLAYGEQRRLGIALAAAAAPQLLLLDEPAAGLNPSETAECMALIRQLRDRGTTILLVEHDMAMVMRISDRIVVLNQGRIIADGPPAEIREDPEVIRAYLGTSREVPHAAA
ncbi:amino acid/amide ABC transporter ATP-binding protein 1 (HAAT family) [Humitalea rosea]|uniref:Amino acid/amide ABC transporter ATP-binding protein 1 (HAAT family) n=1 Tax=Humitalea rosea TaxID=990373 RepID=A0A2W7ISC8_9PROT|nr:ABC transporter ATP-binding protein [Humitalea rosea]PZW50501.1 amino acid/amide ABC transporter ATP-binding protein 1 (HAAT family) [Humitalea rosea]